MAAGTLVRLEDYLNTSYDPDVEYVDGVLVERNVGDWLHSVVQSNIGFQLRRKYPSVFVVPELRSQTESTRYRLPDVSVLLAPPATRYLQEPAFLAVEVLSEDDRMSSVMEKLEEYARKGVQNIWLVDPRLQKMFAYRGAALEEVEGAIATGDPRLELTAAEVFQY